MLTHNGSLIFSQVIPRLNTLAAVRIKQIRQILQTALDCSLCCRNEYFVLNK